MIINFDFLCIELNLSIDRQARCEAAHSLTFVFSRPVNMRPLTITLPYPFLVHSIMVDDGQLQKQRSLRVVLKKAFAEPWPGDFSCRNKWSTDNLLIWDYKTQLHLHLDRQFNLGQIVDLLLNEVRLIISGLFQLASQYSVITIRCLEGEKFDRHSMLVICIYPFFGEIY